MLIKKFIVFAVLLIMLIIGSIGVQTQLQIDSCLDGGGRWNYKDGICDSH